MKNLNKIAIVTDSSSDVPHELLRGLPVSVVPMYIGYKDELKRDGFEITTAEVFDALRKGFKVNTSAPSAGDFYKIFQSLFDEGFEYIFCIILSSRLSGTINAASIAKLSLGDSRISIIDSKTSTICLGFTVLQAARAAAAGKSVEEVSALIDELIEKNRFIAILENFEYVLKGGRAAFLSKILSIALKFIPILTIGKNGKVHLKKFAKNLDAAFREIYNFAVLEAKKNKKSKIGIFYGEDSTIASKLEKLFRQNKEINIDELIVTTITTVISAHTGPGLWGIAVSPSY
ncbi:MAG: DegV domain-containing protein [Actinobacteria bacterium ADurb.Bin346]|nr:MAG: DegV domain-containing protein [Actinobacteria bacterium ADurb.Bin346]